MKLWEWRTEGSLFAKALTSHSLSQCATVNVLCWYCASALASQKSFLFLLFYLLPIFTSHLPQICLYLFLLYELFAISRNYFTINIDPIAAGAETTLAIYNSNHMQRRRQCRDRECPWSDPNPCTTSSLSNNGNSWMPGSVTFDMRRQEMENGHLMAQEIDKESFPIESI